MIYKITIVHANPAAGTTELYAHPHWDFPLSKEGDRNFDYKTVFHIEEGADRTHEMRPTVFKKSNFRHVYLQLPDAETAQKLIIPTRTYVLKVEKKSMCEGEDTDLLEFEKAPPTTKDA